MNEHMTRKKIFAAAAAIAAIVLIIIIFPGKKRHEGYVVKPSSKIRWKDLGIYWNEDAFKVEQVNEYFSKEVINPYTLKLFMTLDDRFKDSQTVEELMVKAKDYLYSIMSSHEEADRVFAVYKKYMDCQLGVGEIFKASGAPKTPEEAIEFLQKMQDFRREVMGAEDADALFGDNVMAEEYSIRRKMIINDDQMTGPQKEEMLNDLKREMWGDEASLADDNLETLTRYNEKLTMYKNELDSIGSDEERKDKIKKFREEFFSAEEIGRLEEADKLIADEKKKENDYFRKENAIYGDNSMSALEKEQKIIELQDKVFGNEAEAFRRRLAVEKE